jgi:hypothetical protein
MKQITVILLVTLLLATFVRIEDVGAQTATSFYRAVNLGGDIVTLDGNAWQANSGSTSNLTLNGTVACNPWIDFSPAAAGGLQTMLGCWREHWAHNIVFSSVPNGQYQVYIYALQSWDNTGATAFSISVEGATVGSYNPGTVEGVWSKLGPYSVTVSDGSLNIGTNGGTAVLSGIEVWSGGTAPQATATPTATTAVPLPTSVPGGQPPLPAGSIPQNIRQALARGGVNLTFNFYDVDRYDPRAFDPELPLIAAAGAGHVRIPISLDIIEQGTTGVLRNDRYQDIVDFVNRARGFGLVTIIDIHNTHQKNTDGSGTWNEDYMGGLREASVRTRHLNLMTEFVRRLYQNNVDRSWFVFQPANEPIFVWGDEDIWYNHQEQLLPSMRQACPDCVIFAMAHDWQGVEATVGNIDPSRAPYNDPYLIFDVHFYEPMSLTHCLRSSANNCPNATWPGTFTTWRGTRLWDRAYVAQLIQPLWNWKTRYNVTVHFSEVGTIGALGESVRAAYLGDVVSILRQNGAGYSMYDWHGRFGIKQHPSVVRAVFTPQTATPTPTPTATAAPSAALNVTVSLQGRSSSNLSLTVMRQGVSQTVTTDGNGAFVLSGLPLGTQALYIKHSQTLAETVNLTLNAGSNTVAMGPLRLGDVNNDNLVSLADFSLLANAYNTATGDSGYSSSTDLNGDGQVSLMDFSLLAGNYQQAGAAPPS